MGYGTDYQRAARRHLQAAQILDHQPKRPDVAAYLYGLAAEMALKQLMRRSGMKPPSNDDPFRLHFPALKTALRDQAKGRLQSRLAQLAADDELMNQWDISMRYAPAQDVCSKPITKWADQAKRLVGEMEEYA